MKLFRIFLPAVLLILCAFGNPGHDSPEIISYTCDPRTDHLRLYWKDDSGHKLGSIANLKSYVEKQKSRLFFAMNGGMYKPDHSPQGLFIQDKAILAPLDTASGTGNFYMKPNGVFYLNTDGKAAICKTSSFVNNNINYATQSGPMLLCDGMINTAFKKGSENRNIRNGVGILPDGKVIFAISKGKVNFYDFALFFKDQGCLNALYLDGFVSRAYIPGQGCEQMDGDFGVMIGVADK
jgi:uncharacterized protein YigE (DUF2233 family)